MPAEPSGPWDAASRGAARPTSPDAAPNDAAPNDSAPNDSAPNDSAPNDSAPNDSAPSDAARNDATSNDAARKDADLPDAGRDSVSRGASGPRALGVSLCRRGAEACILVLWRGPDAAAFGEAEEALLRRLWPMLERALGLWGCLESARRTSAAAVAALDAMPFGVAMIDTAGAVLASNRVAEDLIAAGDGIRLGPEGLEAARDGRRVPLRGLLGEEARPGAQPGAGAPEADIRFCAPRRESDQPLTIAVAPLANGTPVFVDRAAAAIVYIGDPGSAVRLDTENLRQLYGLTPAEARLAARLGEGERLAEVAESLNISYETARTHLKRVLSKTGAGRQAELMRLLTCGPGGFGLS